MFIINNDMTKEEKNKLLSKISRLYYIGNLTQQEIADKLNISRTKVSRYLDKAREEKIVEIKINSPRENYEELEYVIEKRYKINECIVVPTYENREEILKEMAKELGNIFERILNDRDYLGIGWGTSLKSVADYLDINRKAHIKVVPIIGGLGKVGTGIHTNSVARAVAGKLGGISYMIHCPAVMDSKEAKEIIEKDSNTKEIIEMSDRINVAMVGMSDISPESTLVKTGNFSIEEFDYLSSLGIVGDVNLIFINEDGEHVKSKMDDRIIRISTDKIKKIKNVIGVGFGDRKVKVIIGALRGKFINILLTDEKTAKKIIVEG